MLLPFGVGRAWCADAAKCYVAYNRHNYADAQRLCHLAADQGDGGAEYLMGAMYEFGIIGVNRNYSEAMRWYGMSAAQRYAQNRTDAPYYKLVYKKTAKTSRVAKTI